MGSLSKFPNGFNSGVAIRGVTVLNSHGGDVYWVDSGGLQNGDGTFTRPYLTIDTAINNCTANNGDLIIVKPGHAETLATASAITADIAGVAIIGLGSGADRPTLTFSGTAATMVISAASVTVQNIITKPSIDSVVSPIVVSGADCWLDIEHQDASAAIEAVAAILTTAGADRLHVDLKYRGFIAGNACVNAVRLVGVDTGEINVDFYGVASTAIVEFHTTACHNITVTGNFYNSGTTNLSKNVVDTVTGSTWSVQGYDSAAAQEFSGGSGAAIAGDDIGALTAAVAVIDGFHDVPTADVATNSQMRDVIGNKTDAGVQAIAADKSLVGYIKGLLDILAGTAGIASFPAGAAAANAVSMAEVLRYTQENVINGTGTALPTNQSLYDVLAGANGIATFPAAAAAANGVSMAEVSRYISENQLGTLVSKAYADLTGYDDAAAFTVTGDVMVKIVGVVGATAITSTSGTTTLSVGTTELATGVLPAATIDNTQFAATDVWVDASPANDVEIMASDAWVIVGGGADINLVRSVDDITAGALTLYCWWKPLSAGATVVAA